MDIETELDLDVKSHSIENAVEAGGVPVESNKSKN